MQKHLIPNTPVGAKGNSGDDGMTRPGKKHHKESGVRESHLPLEDWRIQPKPERTPSAATTQTDHLSPQNRPLQTEWSSQEDWRKDLSSRLLWRGGPNIRTLPAVLLILPPSKAADMAHWCVPQNQVLGVCRRFIPDIQVCGTHGREGLVNATITSKAEEEEEEEDPASTALQEHALTYRVSAGTGRPGVSIL